MKKCTEVLSSHVWYCNDRYNGVFRVVIQEAFLRNDDSKYDRHLIYIREDKLERFADLRLLMFNPN